ERSNVDLFLFILVTISGLLMLHSNSFPLRLLGYVIGFFVSLLKFYPITMMMLAVRENVRRFICLTLISTCSLGLFVYEYFSDILRVLQLTPKSGYFASAFGAKNLPFGVVSATQYFTVHGTLSLPEEANFFALPISPAGRY